MSLIEQNDVIWNRFITRLSAADILKSLSVSCALDAQLQSLLQTFVRNREGAGRIGKLDTNRLYRLAVGNDRIFKRRSETRSIDTEVIVVVDISGSMKDESKDIITSRALYAVMNSLRKIKGVTSSAMGFTSGFIVTILDKDKPLTTHMCIQPHGGTNCGGALQRALFNFEPSLDSRKIVIMLTDGETQLPDAFEEAITVARRNDVELVGVGIKSNCITNYLPADECCVIYDLRQLVPEMFRILRRKLLEQR